MLETPYSMERQDTLLFSGFEIEICEVHITSRYHVHSQYTHSLWEFHLDQILHDVPVMPLSPRDRVGGVVCRHDIYRPSELLSVQVERYFAAAI